jgi:hypothetical protein
MKSLFKPALVAAVLALSSGAVASAQQSNAPPLQTGDPARPADATANRPSDTGAQSTLPRGAVTGAGHAQTAGQVDAGGRPGGLEAKANAADDTAKATNHKKRSTKQASKHKSKRTSKHASGAKPDDTSAHGSTSGASAEGSGRSGTSQ